MKKIFIHILFLLFSISSFSQVGSLRSGLVAYYRFEGESTYYTYEEKGVYNAYQAYEPYIQYDGFKNDCFYYNDNGYVVLPEALKMTSVFSISCWIRPTSITNSGLPGIFGGEGGGVQTQRGGVCIYFRDAYDGFYLDIHSATARYPCKVVLSEIGFTLNTWYHVVCAYDGAKTLIYLNGELMNTNEMGWITIDWTGCGVFGIGNDFQPYQGPNPFHGRIDEFMIYNRALSVTEVKYLFNYQSGILYP